MRHHKWGVYDSVAGQVKESVVTDMTRLNGGVSNNNSLIMPKLSSFIFSRSLRSAGSFALKLSFTLTVTQVAFTAIAAANPVGSASDLSADSLNAPATSTSPAPSPSSNAEADSPPEEAAQRQTGYTTEADLMVTMLGTGADNPPAQTNISPVTAPAPNLPVFIAPTAPNQISQVPVPWNTPAPQPYNAGQFNQSYIPQPTPQMSQPQVNQAYSPQANPSFSQDYPQPYNPQFSPQYNPQFNQTYPQPSPSYNPQFNPQWNQPYPQFNSSNSQFNQPYNPQFNPQYTQTYNSQFNQPNPQFNQQYSQPYNPQFSPQYSQPNPQFNPQYSQPYNPQFSPQYSQPNPQYNPQYSQPYNPQFNQSQLSQPNPQFNQPYNPQFNQPYSSPNPQFNQPYNPQPNLSNPAGSQILQTPTAPTGNSNQPLPPPPNNGTLGQNPSPVFTPPTGYPAPPAQTQAPQPPFPITGSGAPIPPSILPSSALTPPTVQLQGAYLLVNGDSAARARLSASIPLTPRLLFGGAFDINSGNLLGEEGLQLTELFLATSIPGLPNLRIVGGQLDLTSYFDRNSFSKDALSQFTNPIFQTNPALSAANIGSRPGVLVNWTVTDNVEARAAAFSSAREIGDFALDGFAGEVGFRVGNAIVRGTYASTRNTFVDEGSSVSDRQEAFGVNAEVYVPSWNMGIFGRYGQLDQGTGSTQNTYSGGVNFLDVFAPDDRLGLAYGRALSDEAQRRRDDETIPDALELFYDFRVLSNLRLGFTIQQIDGFSETIAGFRVRTDFDVTPRGLRQ